MGYYNGLNVYTKQKHDEGVAVNTALGRQKETKKRFSAGDVIETIFNDEDFDCRSDMEIYPAIENEECSDIDISEQLQRLEIERQQHEAIATDTV